MTTAKQKPASKKSKEVKKSTKKVVNSSGKGQLKIKLVRSPIGYPSRQRDVIRGLGLRKLNSQVLRKDSPEIRGMVMKISHLVQVEAIEES